MEPVETDWSRVSETWVYEQAGEFIEIELIDIVEKSTLNRADAVFRYETSAWDNYNPNVITQEPKTPLTEALQTKETIISEDKMTVGENEYKLGKSFIVWIELGTGVYDSVRLDIDRESGVCGVNFEIDYGSESFCRYGDRKGTAVFRKIN